MNLTTQASTASDLSKITFLVVDDKAFYRDMAHTALTRAKARNIEHAADIEKASQLITRYGQRFGCVICDWDIAPAGGLDLLKMIRSRGFSMLPANTPFVILTGRADSAAIKAAMALDVSGVAIAPLSFEKLTKVITNAVSRTWTLKPKDEYAAVQLVSSTKAAPPPGTGANKSPNARTILHKDTGSGSSGTHPAASAGSTAARKPSAPPAIELKKVHLSNLVHVSPGDVVARDIKDKDGKMLVSTGTVLSTTIIDRLKDHAGGHPDSYHLWVGEFDK